MTEKKIASCYDGDGKQWASDIIDTFPRGISCPICGLGKFELWINGAVANAECDSCRTVIRYYYYDTKYPYLDQIAASFGQLEEENSALIKLLEKSLDLFPLAVGATVSYLPENSERCSREAKEIYDEIKGVLARSEGK